MWVRFVLAVSLSLITLPAWAMEHYINTLQDPSGNAIPAVAITVTLAGTTTLATLYSDNGTTIQSNPFYSDAYGYVSFFATNGVYDLNFEKVGYTFGLPFNRIALFDVNDGGGGGGGGGLTTPVSIVNGGTGLATAPDDTLLIGSGSVYGQAVVPDCAVGTTSKLLYDPSTNTISCGVDSGGTFDTIGSGNNTTAAMTVDSGATLTFSGTGVVNASSYRGNATVAVADGGTGQTSVTDDGLLVANGTLFQLKILPSCSNATNDKLLYTTSTNSFSCGVDQSVGGGTTFNSIGSGTNTTATMTVGTGGTVTLSGTGNVTSNSFWPNLVTVDAGNSPYTALTTNAMLLCDTTAAGRTITLPAATNKVVLTIVNVGSNSCTINRAGADTITTGLSSGLTSFILRNAGSSFWLQPDGAATWYVGG